MKISTKRDALFAQLQTVTRAASTRSAVQALSGVHLQASGGAIELRATDMEIGLRVPLEGEVVRDGLADREARIAEQLGEARHGELLPAGAGGRLLVRAQRLLEAVAGDEGDGTGEHEQGMTFHECERDEGGRRGGCDPRAAARAWMRTPARSTRDSTRVTPWP